MPPRGAQGAVRVEGLRELRRALNSVEKGAARDLNKSLRQTVSQSFLPPINRATPVDRKPNAKHPGKLARSNRVSTRGDKLQIRNFQPYANAVHWGRSYWPNKGHPKAVRSKVTKNPWIYRTVVEKKDIIVDEMAANIDAALRREIKPPKSV